MLIGQLALITTAAFWARLHLVRDALGLSAAAAYLWAGH
jgi:hypothetical protein